MRYFNRVTKAKQKLNKANILNLSLNIDALTFSSIANLRLTIVVED